MVRYLKIAFGLVVVCLVFRACRLEYVCNIVDSIPVEIRERIIEERPECTDIGVLADFWVSKGDSVVEEVAEERELEQYIK